MFVSPQQREVAEPLASVVLLAGLIPELGAELEDSAARPGGQEREHVAEIGPRLDAVELAARDERDGDGIPVRAIVAAAEEPVLAADHLAPQLELGEVVVEAQVPILEEAPHRDTVVVEVLHRLADRRVLAGQGLLSPDPRVELGEHRRRERFALRGVDDPRLRIGRATMRVVDASR